MNFFYLYKAFNSGHCHTVASQKSGYDFIFIPNKQPRGDSGSGKLPETTWKRNTDRNPFSSRWHQIVQL